ncbi:MAG: hypothetical protein NC117_01085 [Pseudoflavonifractor sp.]|nr:hypothetical protein [Pseudoflavonifractor sp.]
MKNNDGRWTGYDFSDGRRPECDNVRKQSVLTVEPHGGLLCDSGAFPSVAGRGSATGRARGTSGNAMAVRATECRNLRAHTDASGRYLAPVTAPRCIALTDSRPFFTFAGSDGDTVLFLSRGDTLEVLDETSGATATVGRLPDVPLCAVQSGDNVVVMTRRGSVTVSRDGEGTWAIGRSGDSMPVLQTCTGETREFESVIPARSFATPYTRWNGRLTDTDAATLTSDLAEAYEDCVRQAAEAGYFTAPVVVGYSLAGAAPSILTAAGIFQLPDPVTLTVTTESGMYTGHNACVVKLRGYRLTVRVADNPSDYSGMVSVRVSPQLHVVNPATAVVYRQLSGSSGATLQAWMPGIPRQSSTATQAQGRLIAEAAAGLQAMSPDMTLQGPMTPGTTVGEIMPGEVCSVAEDRARLAAMSATTASDTTLTDGEWRASTVRQAGDMVVWGDITTSAIAPMPLTALAATTRAGSWHGCVTVTLGDGRGQVVWSGEGRDNCPDLLWPLLCYPAAGATTMTIRLTSADGLVRRLTVPLSPSPDGRMSIYFDPSCAPVSIPPVDEDYLIPASTAADIHRPGLVVTARVESPLQPLTSKVVTEGSITTLAGASKAASSLDVTRTRLYLFATSGICILSVSSTTGAVSSRRISRHPVTSPDHIAETPSMVAALSGDSLLVIDGNRVTVAAHGKRYTAIGYDAAHDELALIDSEGILTATSIPAGESYTSDLRPTGFYCDHRLILRLDDRLLDMSSNDASGAASIVWEGEISCFPHTPVIAGSLGIELFSSMADCRIRLLGAAGADTPLPITTLRVRGAVNHQLTARVAAPWRRRLTVRIEGTADADTRLYGLRLNVRD